VLLWIQFARVVNPEVGRRIKRWRRAVRRHATDSKAKSDHAKEKRQKKKKVGHARGLRPPEDH